MKKRTIFKLILAFIMSASIFISTDNTVLAQETPPPTPGPTAVPQSGGQALSTAGAPACRDAKPSDITLLSAVRLKSDMASLIWTYTQTATSYSVFYGLNPKNYTFGIANVGKATSYDISQLDPNSKYCFAVKSNNGCQSSDFSNEICVDPTKKEVGKAVLGISKLASTGTQNFEPVTLSDNPILLDKNFISPFEKPASIQINNAKISVEEGFYQNDQWLLEKEKALYLLNSGIPGKAGNIVIYGHNTENVFGKLSQSKLGDKVSLTTDSGEVYEYKINQIKTVLSSNVEVLRQTTDEQITIFTCNGLFDSTRLVVSGVRI